MKLLSPSLQNPFVTSYSARSSFPPRLTFKFRRHPPVLLKIPAPETYGLDAAWRSSRNGATRGGRWEVLKDAGCLKPRLDRTLGYQILSQVVYQQGVHSNFDKREDLIRVKLPLTG
jgi:hypothetical protein